MLKRLLLASLALVLLGIAVVYFVTLQPNRAVALFSQLRQGMPLAEAKALLGAPDVTMKPDEKGHPIGYSWGVEGDWVGKPMGKYQVLDVLGQGAMGVVLKALDPLLEREVAIKILAEHLASDATALARFMSEARAAGKLNHPNVMAIYGICQEGETYFLVLEYVPGGNLADRLANRGPLQVLEATQALIEACQGVGAAHADSIAQILYQHCHGRVPDPRSQDPSISDASARIVARAMAKDPDRRYQSTDEMLADLQETKTSLTEGTRVARRGKRAGAAPRSAAGHPGNRSLNSRLRLIVAAGGTVCGGTASGIRGKASPTRCRPPTWG